ncbi:MAG: right-handed parallel beta-helix repeat-containing protein [Candidatus Methanoperedens sp.]|nr:right-handed parallel beta-helix repeat-containing protein [Candidatus Methanoperedens sp.]
MNNRNGLIYAFRIAVGITLLVLLLGDSASAATIKVPEDYAKIQWAIDNATAGDTIQVQSGTYYENVNVNKQLTLRGIGMPVVNANYIGNAITLAADGITLEGFSATATAGMGAGFALVSSRNNTLINNNASGCYIGFNLEHSGNNTLSGNTASFSHIGFILMGPNHTLIGNNASNNYYGIWLSSSNNNTLIGNIMINNKQNFRLWGWIDSDYYNNIDITNTVNGKPIYYLQGVSDKVYDKSANAGTFYCINCNNITVRDSIFANNMNGVFFRNTNNSKIENIDASGNTYGIHLSFSSNNKLINNNASNNIEYGDEYSLGYGIFLSSSNNNTLIGNNASNNGDNFGGPGISLSSSNNNTLIGNTASNNKGYDDYGISLYSSSNNKIFHNNLNKNPIQAYDNSNNNFWDNGYPSGGNYWSDYTGIDLKSGSNQNLPGSDGIGDTSYPISGGSNVDRYPLMKPYLSISPNLVISNIVAATGKAYVQDTLAVGKLVYIDRTYKFTAVPTSYNGLKYIQTAIDDKYDIRNNFLQFDVNQDVTVYVAYDDRISPKPSWLTSSFTDTGENLVRDGPITFSIYSKAYPSGHVSLSGNSVPSGGAGGMYVVIVKPSGAPLPTALSVSISESPDPVTSGGTAQVTAHVTSGGINVSGANVGLSVTGGSLVLNSGTTNSNGDFTTTYTAPTVTTSTILTISATASMTGYTTGSGTDQITVNPESSGLVISNIIAGSGKTYVLDTLSVGKLLYRDRNYLFKTVPSSYAGLNYIRSANADSTYTSSNFLQFDINNAATVYVAYDDRIPVANRPIWLKSNFVDTGQNLVRDSSSVTYSIFSRSYPAGHISLGGNAASGYGMYIVIVKP